MISVTIVPSSGKYTDGKFVANRFSVNATNDEVINSSSHLSVIQNAFCKSKQFEFDFSVWNEKF